MPAGIMQKNYEMGKIDHPAIIYLFKVNNGNIRKDVKYIQSYNNNTRPTSDVCLMFSVLTLSIFHTFF